MKNLFPFLFLGVFLIFHLSIYFLFIKQIIKVRIPRVVLKYFLVFNFFGVVLYFFGRYFVSFPQSLYFLVSLSIGVGFVLFVVTLVYQFLSLGLRICAFLSPRFLKERRAFFQKTINICSGIFALGYLGAGVVEGAMEPKVERVRIPLKNLNGKFKAVQISDLHIGGLIEESVVRSIVAEVNALSPDFIVLTGDIIDTEISKISKAMAELGNLKAPLGVYFVTGNHEYFHGVGVLLEALKKQGVIVLENSCVQIKKDSALLNLAGVYDLFGRRIGALEPDLQKALQNRVENAPTILLAHQPRFALEVEKSDKVDLILSGHTHGGQIFPFRFLVKLQQPYLKGLYKHNEETQIYVNRGTGFWGPPVRILSRSEITLFEFVDL